MDILIVEDNEELAGMLCGVISFSAAFPIRKPFSRRLTDGYSDRRR